MAAAGNEHDDDMREALLGDTDEEEAARKAGHTVKSARETAQHTASGTYACSRAGALGTLFILNDTDADDGR